MTAAHLVLVWEERDDPNLLWHAQRAMEVGRNPRVVAYEPGSARARRTTPGRPPGGPSTRSVADSFGRSLTLGVEEEHILVDAGTLEPAPGVERLRRPSD